MDDMLTQSMRPQLKADTHYIPVSQGVYLRRNNSRLFLKGKSLYRLLEHLVPNLDGKLTLEELVGGLDADRTRMVTNLLEKLFARDFLKDTSQDQAHSLHGAELETYAPDITFIESFQTSAAYRFEAFRQKQLLLLGSGPALASLVQATIQCGVKQINVLDMSEAESPASLLDLNPDAAEDALQRVEAPAWENEAEVQRLLQDYDAILHIASEPELALARLLNRLCLAEEKTLIQAIIVDDHAWLGPLVTPEMGNCWECAWRRLQATMASCAEQPARYAFHTQPRTDRSQPLDQPEATMLAQRLLFRVFQHFTETSPSETLNKLDVLDLKTCLSESHAFQPHPLCQACQHSVAPTTSQFLAQVQQIQDQPALDPEVFLETLATCIDKKLGLFSAFGTQNFVQVPLAVYQAELSNPLLSAHKTGPCRVSAVSTDTNEALMRTAQKACERYAVSLVDQRRLLSSAALEEAAVPVMTDDAWRKTEALALEDDLWTWALDVQTREAVLVPAAAVFCGPDEQGRGLASGQSWEEALCQAVLDWCSALTIKHVQDTQQIYPQVDLERALLTPTGVHLSRLLAITGHVEVYDITGPLQVPTFATCLDGKVVACTTHCDAAQALNLGLEQALQHYQAELFHQPDYAPAAVPDFPMNRRGDQLNVPAYALPETWPARLAWLLQRLQTSGLHAYAVPLNHDLALARALPFIVRVLVSGVEEGK